MSNGVNMPPLPPAPTPVAKPALPSISKADQKRLNDATADFEAMFIQQLFKSMRRAVPEDPNGRLFAKSSGEKIFQEMLDSEYSKNMSRGNSGLGLKEAIFKQAVARQIGEVTEAQAALDRSKKTENSLNAVAQSPIGKGGVAKPGFNPYAIRDTHLPAAGNPTRVGPADPVNDRDS
ncbi:MAG: rod-binding protein [Magnetococcales bacterium]|nr:rod-binding protein [Magnetococcales bacterium]MBF0262496.1 rod-binding protein [Magnetococcales bacterium]